MQLFDLDDLNPTDIDAIEIHPCVSEYQDGKLVFTEQCHPDVAQFYGVFFHLKTGGLTCIADCADANIADHVAKCLSRLLNKPHFG
jgi:hypothetical protein